MGGLSLWHWLIVIIVVMLLFGRGKTGLVVAELLAGVAGWAMAINFKVLGFGFLLQRGLFDFALGVLAFWLHQRWRDREIGAGLLTLLELALLAGVFWVLWQPGKDGSWVLLAAPLYAALVIVFARDRGLVARTLHARPLLWLAKLSFALFMVHLFWVILPNRFGPGILAAMGHADWIAPVKQTYGLLSMAPPPLVATAISLVLLAGALATAWLTWRFIEEPARHWTRRFAPPTS